MSEERERRPLIAGNWKMNGLRASESELAAMLDGVRRLRPAAQVLVCPPATLLSRFAEVARGSDLRIGAQNCHHEPAGAFTGDLSAEMLGDAGASAVILGHSERRIHHREADAAVRAKVEAAWRAGLTAIVCVGETREEREANEALAVIGKQFEGSLPDQADARRLVLAYEPVWAIGTGLTPTVADVAEMHDFIRARLVDRYGEEGRGVRILYGGSVKPANAAELLAVENVDGALVGGASLKAEDFLGIVRAATEARAAQ